MGTHASRPRGRSRDLARKRALRTAAEAADWALLRLALCLRYLARLPWRLGITKAAQSAAPQTRPDASDRPQAGHSSNLGQAMVETEQVANGPCPRLGLGPRTP